MQNWGGLIPLRCTMACWSKENLSVHQTKKKKQDPQENKNNMNSDNCHARAQLHLIKLHVCLTRLDILELPSVNHQSKHFSLSNLLTPTSRLFSSIRKFCCRNLWVIVCDNKLNSDHLVKFYCPNLLPASVCPVWKGEVELSDHISAHSL